MGTDKKRIIIYPKQSYQIMKILFDVQNELGTKYQEKHYQRALEIKFNLNKIPFKKEVKINLDYEGEKLGAFYADFIVYDKILLELKTTNFLHQDHARQRLRYLVAYNLQLGILVNFRIKPLQYKRIINPRYKD